jgi:putative Mn2+ efflux pump MntP
VLAVLLVAVSVGMSNFAASIGLGAGGASARTRLHVALIFGLFEGGMPALGLLLGRSLAGTLGQAAHWAGAGLLIATGGYGLIQAARAARAAGPPRDQPIPGAAESAPGRAGPAAGKIVAGAGETGGSGGRKGQQYEGESAAGRNDAPAGPGESGPAVPAAPGPEMAPAGPSGQPVGRLLVTGLALSMDNLVVGFAVGTFPVSLATAVIVIAAVSVGMSLAGLELGSRLGARLGARTGSRGELLGGLALIGVGIALAAGVP